MNRIEELVEKFPQIPRTLILKLDIMREGLKSSVDLKRVASWALPDGTIPYNLGHTSDTFVSKEEAMGRAWFGLVPWDMKFRDGTGVKIIVRENAPYEVRYETDGRYMLYRDQEPIEEVYFTPRPDYYTRKTGKSSQMCTVISQTGDNYLFIVTPNHCVYFDTGDDCGFCPIGRTMEHVKEVGVEKMVGIPVGEVEEAFRAAYGEIRAKKQKYLNNKVACGRVGCQCFNLLLSGGSPYNRKKETDNYIPYIEVVKKIAPEVTLTIEIQAVEVEDQKRLHEAGLHCIMMNLEAWEKRVFEVLCPGKAKYVGYEHWIELLIKGTEIYDPGHVVSNFVAGAELIVPNGFKTVGEGLKSTLDGFEWLLQHGVSPSWTPFMGSEAIKLNAPQQPPTEYYLTIGIETHKLHQKYKLYGPSRGFFCYRMGCTTAGDFARLRWYDELPKVNSFLEAEETLLSETVRV